MLHHYSSKKLEGEVQKYVVFVTVTQTAVHDNKTSTHDRL